MSVAYSAIASGAWVATTTVMPSSRFTRNRACRKFFSATGSSWAVGSSSSSRRGCIASVPANVVICFWPPDSSATERRNHGSMPKK